MVSCVRCEQRKPSQQTGWVFYYVGRSYWASKKSERASLDAMEQRTEPRRDERLVVTINGRDKIGQYFTQQVSSKQH
jgi:hypothetical protein